jgi:hypothetical protein
MAELIVEVTKTYTLKDMSYMEMYILIGCLDRVAVKDIFADLPCDIKTDTQVLGETANKLYKVMVNTVL